MRRAAVIAKTLCLSLKENTMRLVSGFAILGLSFGLLALAVAQSPKGDKADSPVVKNIVDRMMAFDKNKDGKLSKDEISDRRLLRLFERADADKDGEVTKEELTALAVRMADEDDGPRRGPGGPPDGPPDGPGRRGPGGFGPPPPGQLLPPFLQDRLKLSAEQKKQLEKLQKDIDGKLNKILTAEQKKQLKEMRESFGRGGPPGGPRGRGPGGPPPGDDDGPPPR
jgi:hypothetical protein